MSAYCCTVGAFSLGKNMLTKDELLIQDTKPLIKDISLKLYKDFCTDVLFKRRFHYYFTDGTDMIVECREWGVYHMLAIHHIDYTIGKENFFNKIDMGLCLDDFKANAGIKKRFAPYKERIALFSCIYRVLRYGKTFYIPTQKVPNTKEVKCDYIIYRQIDAKGMNIGLKYESGCFVPMTNLISKSIDLERYIDTSTLKTVSKLIISNIETGNILEEITYTNDFILHQQ